MATGTSRRLLSTRLGRRTLLRGAASAGALALLGQVPAGVAVASPWTSTVVEAAAGRSKRLDVSSRSIASTAVMSQADDAAETVYVFNVGSRDVTLIDAATRQVRETRPLGAAVRWLSNEQTYWDGQHVWTYDFPDNKLQVIAIDPQAVAVTRTIADIGTGPAHSVMLLPDRTKAVVNVAGDNRLAFLDLAAGQVEAVMETGAYPWDLHFTPDGRFGYVPEREQDTVSKIDLATRTVVKTVAFPAGSKPYMLRVSRDGTEVWVQTAVANTNVVLAADDLAELATESTGKMPITNAGTPDGRYRIITNTGDTYASVFDAKTYREVKRLEIGEGGSNIGFSRDGTTAFITVARANAVAVVDMTRLEVIEQVPVGTQPNGLIVL